MISSRKTIWTIFATACVLLMGAGFAVAGDPAADLTLKGDQDGTVFHSLTVQGENRVRIRFDRPNLGLEIDPTQAPGLELEDAMGILDRTLPDLVTPFLQASISAPSRFTGSPWVQAFVSGPVARFTPELTGVAEWKLQIVDSRSETAMVFAGLGDPPSAIAWDGLRLDGTPAPPGYTYSYVLSALDAAGNQRRFVGDGFTLPAYRRSGSAGPEFLASGAQWLEDAQAQQGAGAMLLEAASAFNLHCRPGQRLEVRVTHRSRPEAEALAHRVEAVLAREVSGAADRIITQIRVQAAAPPAGTLHLAPAPTDRAAQAAR